MSDVSLRPEVPMALVLGIGALLLAVVVWRALAERGQVGAWLLRGAMVLLAVGVVLRPGAGTVPAQASVSDLEVLVVVDRTVSMSAQDWDGSASRLAGVRADLAEITSQLAGSRFALVTFGKVVRVELPFTSDVAAFAAGVETTRREDLFSGTGSLVDRPIDAMAELLAAAEEQHPERRRMVLLLTDGENTAEEVPRSFAELAPLVDGGAVLGYGTEAGGRMPAEDPETDPEVSDDSFVYDSEAGAEALSRIDLDGLGRIADDLGVELLHRERPGGLDPLIESMRPELSADDSSLPVKSELYWILALGLAALALLDLARTWRGLHATRREVRR